MQRDEIGAPEQLGEIDLFHAELRRALGRQERIIGDHLHLQSDRAIGHDRADIAATDDAERLACDLDAHEAVLLPLPCLGGGVRLRDLPRERQHQRDRMLRRRDRIAERRIHHDDALGSRRGDVDVVDADAGAPDHLQAFCLLQDLGRHLGGRAHRQAVEIADQLGELLLVGAELRLEVDLDPAIPEDLHGGGRERIGDENLGRHGGLRPLSLSLLAKAGLACATGDGSWWLEHHAAFGSASLVSAKAQSSHSVSASTSARSTVEPHQMRKPGGASR